jgi:hypothetical protein
MGMDTDTFQFGALLYLFEELWGTPLRACWTKKEAGLVTFMLAPQLVKSLKILRRGGVSNRDFPYLS